MTGAVHPVRQPSAAPAAPQRVDGTLGLFAGGVVALCLAGSAAGAWWMGQTPGPPPASTRVAVGAALVTVPTAWLAGPPDRDRIELALPWADLVPGGAETSMPRLVLTLTPADDAMPPGERPTRLYARFLGEAARPEAGGLIRRAFRRGTPFEGEDLVVAPPDGRAFSARCERAEGAEAAQTCTTELRVGALDLRVRFAPEGLRAWAALTHALRERFGAPGR